MHLQMAHLFLLSDCSKLLAIPQEGSVDMKHALTIAGSDSCGGAGIQADLKTFSALGTYGMSVITAITAQNTMGVHNFREMDTDIVRDQIDCLFEDIRVDAVKIGMVSSIELIDTIAARLVEHGAKNIVVDPVMIAKSGSHLLRPEASENLVKVFFPLAEVVTPNLFEAEAIIGEKIGTLGEMEAAARKIHQLGARNVVVKGGPLTGEAIDVFYDGTTITHIKGTRIDTKNTHGTGCTFSSAITAFIAREYDVLAAVEMAKQYINGAIDNSIELGHGVGPTNHFYAFFGR
jgi:hydroxymethylpyrimidine/phosphomethylpyrimidine kinase